MKIDIIQFFKKVNFAVRLAQYDCLFLVEGLQSFSVPAKIAGFYVVPNNNHPLQKIADFLENEQNPFLRLIFNEVASRPEFSGKCFYRLPPKDEKVYENKSLLKSAAYKEDWEEIKNLFQNIVVDEFPFLAEHFKSLLPIADLQQDMRFLGVEFERLAEYTASCPHACEISIDWGLTDKPELYLDISSPLKYTSDLPSVAQQNLAGLYTYLFFEKAIFPGNFPGVAVDEDNRVNFIDFDCLHPVDSALCRYAIEYLKNGEVPKGFMECRLRRSLDWLCCLCADIDVLPFFEKAFSETSQGKFLTAEEDAQTEWMAEFAKQGMVLQPYSNLPDPNPNSLTCLLKNPSLKKDKMFRKSSAWYYIPLLFLIYLVLKFF